MTVVLVVTVICLLIPVYVYFGYPALLWILTRGKPATNHFREEGFPSVALIISCYNEADIIREKLQNALELDYPEKSLRIIVVSDGSEDGTDELVREFTDPRITLIRQEGRLGKTMGLNLAMEQVSEEVTVFSDANAMYAPDALSKLVRNLADPRVGYVVGAALYTDGDQGPSAKNENLYWRYELAIKSMESRLHSVVGGDGAIYAIRTELWEPLQQQDINDFVNPLQIVVRGYRGVFDAEARCFEETAGEFSREISRKERIVNRSIRGLMRVPAAMNPFRTGLFAWQVISHKLLRWLIPLFAALGLAGSALLAAQGMALFQFVTAGGLALLLAAMAGARQANKNHLPAWQSLPYYFVMVNLHALKGIIRALQGHTQVTWRSARPAGNNEASPNGKMPLHPLWWWATGALTLALVVGYV
jgi:cellulose synthase/poly-beta-1,6-N-acetylglucosamine synthase-like glycosyltransferase